ncbi:MAG: nuclease-related domain-containing protein [Candidatus Nanopelagicaceae bacterium]|nr:nuclease-related domain-containing protein [Candidatus Nanopelagicaceae bacterium]
MLNGKFDQIRSARRRRYLGSVERVGRYARKIIWNQISVFTRRQWKSVLTMVLVPILISLPVPLIFRSISFSSQIVASLIMGLWADSIFILLYSGAATTIMGLDGESRTADILRGFRKRGWTLINGIKIKSHSDVDHILVGPGGVLVIETKWSHHAWPANDAGQSSMSSQLSTAVGQALTNRNLVKWRFGKSLEGVEIRAVCVLWSAEDSSNLPQVFEIGSVTVVRGPALFGWLNQLELTPLEKPRIDSIAVEIERQALSRDELERENEDLPHPTFNQMIKSAIFEPLFGFAAAFLIFSGLLYFKNVLLVIGGLAVMIIVGILGNIRIPGLRRALAGWLALCAFFTFLTVLTLIKLAFN